MLYLQFARLTSHFTNRSTSLHSFHILHFCPRVKCEKNTVVYSLRYYLITTMTVILLTFEAVLAVGGVVAASGEHGPWFSIIRAGYSQTFPMRSSLKFLKPFWYKKCSTKSVLAHLFVFLASHVLNNHCVDGLTASWISVHFDRRIIQLLLIRNDCRTGSHEVRDVAELP